MGAGDLYNDLRESFAADGLTKASMDSLRAKQLTSLSLISAWQVAPAGVDGNKYFGNLAGQPVGMSRLPSLPIDADAAAALKTAHASFCRANEAAKFRLC